MNQEHKEQDDNDPCLPTTDAQIVPPGELTSVVAGAAAGLAVGLALGLALGLRLGRSQT